MKIIPEKAYTLQEIINENLIPGVSIYTNVYNLCTKSIEDGDEKIFITSGRRKTLSNKRVFRTDSCRLVAHTTDKMRANAKIVVFGKDIIDFLKKPYKAGVKYYYKGIAYSKVEIRNLISTLSPEELKDFEYLINNNL